MDILLLRPSARKLNYQNLEATGAIEPPHWMACRAQELVNQNHTVSVCDMQIGQPVPKQRFDRCEVWLTGVHPSAWLQCQAAVQPNVTADQTSYHTGLPGDYTNISPRWVGFPFQYYRAHNWHAWTGDSRTPYQTIHSAVSCPYHCKFCTIHKFYTTGYKPRPIPDVIGDFLPGIRNVKMMDEIFLTKSKRTLKLLDAIRTTYGDYYNIWGYARVDSVTGKIARAAKSAGVNWVCLGIESAVQSIREANGKGSFTNDDVKHVVSILKDNGICVLANFMFGFIEDTEDTLRQTLEMADNLQAEYTNFYCVVPYPHTEIADRAAACGFDVSRTPEQWSQYGKAFKPLGTLELEPQEVLYFRDMVYEIYHGSNKYYKTLCNRFGWETAMKMRRSVLHNPLKRDLFGGKSWRDACNE